MPGAGSASQGYLNGGRLLPGFVAPPLAAEAIPGQNLLVILVALLLASALLVLLAVVVVALARRLWGWATGSARSSSSSAPASIARRLAPPASNDSVPPALSGAADAGHGPTGTAGREHSLPDAWPAQASAVLDQYFQDVAALGEAGSAAPADGWVEQVAVRLPGLGRGEGSSR